MSALPQLEEIKLCKISTTPSQPMAVSHSLVITGDLTWKAHIFGHDVTSKTTRNSPLSAIPAQLDLHSFRELLLLLDTAKVCPGHPDTKFEEMSKNRKGTFLSADGKTIAFEDAKCLVTLNGKSFIRTIRTTGCDILVQEGKCHSCRNFRAMLRAMHSRWLKRSSPRRTPRKKPTTASSTRPRN